MGAELNAGSSEDPNVELFNKGNWTGGKNPSKNSAILGGCSKLKVREEFNGVALSGETNKTGEAKGVEESKPSERTEGTKASEADGLGLAEKTDGLVLAEGTAVSGKYGCKDSS